MKNLLFSLIAIVLLSNVSFGQKISDLSLDSNFISYVNNELIFKEKANLDLLKEIITVTLTEENIGIFYKTFSTNENDFIDFMNSQNLKLRDFSNLYNFKSYEEEELLKILNNEVLEVLTSIQSKANPCRKRYINTLQINLSVAIAGHIACGTVDITVVLGLICHGAILLGQNAANNNAYLDYIDCMGN